MSRDDIGHLPVEARILSTSFSIEMTFAMETRFLFTRNVALPRYRFVKTFQNAFLPSRKFQSVYTLYSKYNVKYSLFLARATEQDPEGSFTGDWPMNWSLASYEVHLLPYSRLIPSFQDMSEFYGGQLLKEEV